MKYLATFVLCFVILFGLFYSTKTSDFNLRTYIETLSFNARPALPTLKNPDGTELDPADSGKSIFTIIKNYFLFFWNCLKYPFEMLFWLFSLVGKIVGGLIVL